MALRRDVYKRQVLDYVENAEKTTAVSTGDGDLSDVIDYAIQQRKTSRPQVRDGEEVVQRFVSGIDVYKRQTKGSCPAATSTTPSPFPARAEPFMSSSLPLTL